MHGRGKERGRERRRGRGARGKEKKKKKKKHKSNRDEGGWRREVKSEKPCEGARLFVECVQMAVQDLFVLF